MPPQAAVKGRNWGVVHVDAATGFQLLDGDAADSASIVSVPKDAIAAVTRKTGDVSLSLKRAPGPATGSGVVLSEIRFAVPKICAGFNESPDASKEIAALAMERLLGVAAGGAVDGGAAPPRASGAGADPATSSVGTAIGMFDDVTVTQPSGLFNLFVSSGALRFVDSKKGVASSFTIRTADVLRLFTLPVPADANVRYAVVALNGAVKTIGQATLRCIVMLVQNETSPSYTADSPFVLDPAATKDPNTLKTLFPEKCFVQPAMTGSYADVLLGVLKTVAQCPLIGSNSDVSFRSSRGAEGSQCSVACCHKAGNGALYVNKASFLFLHRPAVFVPYDAVDKVSFEMSTDNFTLCVDATLPGAPKPEQLKFSNLPRGDYMNLVTYLKSKNLNVVEQGNDEEDDEEEDDE